MSGCVPKSHRDQDKQKMDSNKTKAKFNLMYLIIDDLIILHVFNSIVLLHQTLKSHHNFRKFSGDI